MLDGWFCRTVANQKSMDQIDQDEDAQSDSQEGKLVVGFPLVYSTAVCCSTLQALTSLKSASRDREKFLL